MYTRSRQSQGYANARNQNNSNVGYQGQNTELVAIQQYRGGLFSQGLVRQLPT